MKTLLFRFALLFACVLTMTSVSAQSPRQLQRGRLGGSLDLLGNRITEQRVQRQTEVTRLEQALRAQEERIERLERQLTLSTQPPLLTMEEAEAEVEFADARLQESEQLHEEGKLSGLTLAEHRLASVRAKGQLSVVRFAHADRLIALEMEVLYAQRHADDKDLEYRQLERFVAKGYSSSDALKRSAFDRGLAEKQVELAKLRLTAQRQAANTKDAQQLIPKNPVVEPDRIQRSMGDDQADASGQSP